MSDVEKHYETHLASYYTWMLGGPEAAQARSRAWLERLELIPFGHRRAVDLGAGAGAQSVPLAELGWSVVAIDLSERLLTELAERAHGLSIECVRGDLMSLTDHLAEPVDLCVCMGDTLTHLPDLEAVRRLLADCAKVLRPGGRLSLGFRDLTQELSGLDRFLPLRSETDRIATAVLEYTPTHVGVTDLLHERDGSGWTLRKSAYRKLRISPAWLRDVLGEVGFSVEHFGTGRGLVELVGRIEPHTG